MVNKLETYIQIGRFNLANGDLHTEAYVIDGEEDYQDLCRLLEAKAELINSFIIPNQSDEVKQDFMQVMDRIMRGK